MLDLKMMLMRIVEKLFSSTQIKEEMLTLTYSGKSVNIYFRSYGNTILSILMAKETESMTLPTSWTHVGTLANIKPSSARYVSFISSNGLTGTFRIYSDGGVRIVAHSSKPYWLQTCATVIYK